MTLPPAVYISEISFLETCPSPSSDTSLWSPALTLSISPRFPNRSKKPPCPPFLSGGLTHSEAALRVDCHRVRMLAALTAKMAAITQDTSMISSEGQDD